MSTDYLVGAEDDEALDILWGMVMEEGNENAIKNLDIDIAQTMLKSHAAFSSMLDLEDISKDTKIVVPLEAVHEELEEEEIVMNTDEENTAMVKEISDPLPAIVDFTPEGTLLSPDLWKCVKVVVSCSCPFPEKRANWVRYLALVKIKRRTRWSTELDVKEVTLVPVTPLNPYSCRCIIPLVGIGAGPRFVTMIETILPESKRNTAVGDMLRHAWVQSFQSLSLNGGKPLFNTSINDINSSIQVLSQLSNGFFEIIDPNTIGASMVYQDRSDSNESESENLSQNQSKSSGSSHERKYAATPNAALAFVAAALTDFPNPGISGAIPMNQLLPTSADHSRKRRASTEVNEFRNTDLTDAASGWANAASGDKLGETKSESLDRRCKVRLVERLTHVIKDTNVEATSLNKAARVRFATENPGIIPSGSHNRNMSNSTPMHSKGNSISNRTNTNVDLRDSSSSSSDEIQIDNINLSDINENQMDSLLDGLMVRIVENLMEITSSGTDMKSELNTADQSGFTLLHYACLYNLSSLLPVLFFHGVSPNIPTSQGKLTPLHLACSAGNLSIVELLVQKGARILIQDSYGATPLDHAIRNNFPEIARWLAEKAGLECPTSKTNIMVPSSHQNSIDFDHINKEILLQNAFSNLSLKDKIVLHLLEEKDAKGNPSDRTEKMETEVDDTQGQDDESSYELFSKKERESLAVAMSLMSKAEQDEIQERASGDMRKWLLMHNYEALKESEALAKIADTKATLEIKKKHVSKSELSTNPNERSINAKELAKKRLDDAISGLVLRKNMQVKNITPDNRSS